MNEEITPDLNGAARALRDLATQLEQLGLTLTAAVAIKEKKPTRFNPRKFTQAIYEAGEPVSSIQKMLDKRGVNVSRRTIERWTKPIRDNDTEATTT